MAFPADPRSAHAVPRYPKHLLPLCFDTCSNYITRLASLSADFKTDEERDAFLFTPGNWLRRWQSDDSELFPAFYRAYHRQLALYLSPTIEHYETLNEPVPLQILLRAPGYAHLATVFAKKCHAYILGSINAVTTSSSTQGFDATESAGIKASQKPAVLETANRRLTETISTLINGHIVLPDSKGRMVECDGQQLWSSILDLWTKSLIGKTSLYAPKGVFSLFDLLDGIVDPPHDPLTGERRLKEVSLLDVPHLIHVIRLVLHQAEHALTIVKVAAFVFTHWEVLTARSEDRKELCLGLLLEKELFERLTLFWSQSVRSYVLRLVVSPHWLQSSFIGDVLSYARSSGSPMFTRPRKTVSITMSRLTLCAFSRPDSSAFVNGTTSSSPRTQTPLLIEVILRTSVQASMASPDPGPQSQ